MGNQESHCGYYIYDGHRFFCGEPIKTDFKKISSGGIQGARLFNVKELIGEPVSIMDIAEKLKTLTWN